MTGTGDPQRVTAIAATASMVDVLGVQPAQGRWMSEAEDAAGGPKVAVVTHGFWQNQLAGDSHVLSRTLVLSGESVQVIGVMPEGFAFRAGQIFVPLQTGPNPTQRGSHFLQIYARLQPGVTVEQATAEMRNVGGALAQEFGHNHGIDVRSYYEAIVGGIRSSLQMLMGAVVLVLVIACANVANLLLAAGLARRRELSIRLAMGARRLQLARLLVAEGLVLSTIGGAVGILLAQWAVKVFVTLAGTQLPRGATVAINGQVLMFAAGTTVVVGLVCGLWPLVRMRTRELATTVRDADTRTTSGGGGRFGSGLVVAEIAIACALLVGAGLLVKNLTRLQGRDTGLRTDGIVTFDISPSGPRYREPVAVQAFYRDLLTRLQGLGSVERVGFTSHLPMYNFGFNGEMTRDAGILWGPNDAPLVEYRWVSGDYFQALDVPLVKGRWLDGRDRTGSTTVLINKAMADKFWPGEDPLGRRFGQGTATDQSQWYEVVGVVGDMRSFGLTRAVPLEFYRTLEQDSFSTMTVVLRTHTDEPTAVIPAARQIVASLDPSLPLTGVQRMDEVVAASVGQPRFLTALSTVFGALAGLLAMVGVYGVMTYNVHRQRREFGIRLALGADARSVRDLVIRRGLVLAAVGVAFGMAGAWALSRWIASMLTDVAPTDPAVFAAIAVTVVAVVCVASWFPARAASRVDPMVAMRE
jgi:predicted permease